MKVEWKKKFIDLVLMIKQAKVNTAFVERNYPSQFDNLFF